MKEMRMTNHEATSRSNRVALVEGPRFADCRFKAAWLSSAANLQAHWLEAVKDDDFRRQITRVLLSCVPDFEEAAFMLLVELGKEKVSFIVDLEDWRAQEFAMMERLGFFDRTGERYQMTIPSNLSIRQVKKAALAVEATEDDEYFLRLDQLIVTIPISEAKNWQQRLHEMDQGEREVARLMLLDQLRAGRRVA